VSAEDEMGGSSSLLLLGNLEGSENGNRMRELARRVRTREGERGKRVQERRGLSPPLHLAISE